MNIVGEGFPSEIIGQVDVRQKIHGSGWNFTRDANQIKYLNANTSWVKLVSGVDVDDPKVLQDASLNSLGSSIQGDELAKKFILFNGTQNSAGNRRSGVSVSTIGLSGAYGLGGNDFGARPMMGITSAEIKHKNRGSIRTASVKIRAFNKVQFDIIDALYLRLGFSVLLEWGHSMYYNNNGRRFYDNPNDSLAIPFLNGGVSYADFLSKIQAQRLSSQGNYDAMFAKVSNFHWSFLPDGSYDITVDLVSVGDVMESFKINSLTNFPSVAPGVGVPPVGGGGGAPPPGLAEFINSISKIAKSSTLGIFLLNLITEMINSGVDKYSIDPANPNFGGFSDEAPTTVSAINITFTNTPENFGTYYYVRLGTLLKFIQDKIMYVQSHKGGGTVGTKLLKIDTKTLTNLMYLNGDKDDAKTMPQVSTDPRICMVNRSIIQTIPGFSILTFASQGDIFEQTIISALSTAQGNYAYGQIMNIYVNIPFILNKLDELKNPEDNKVTLIDFLNTILSSINGALGGVNALEATIDETINTVIIRDSNPLPDRDAILGALGKPTGYAKFGFIGYRGQPGYSGSIASFIRDFSFKTEVSPALSTMVTVGATANSSVVGENATAFSKFNVGLKDRYKEEVAQTDADLAATRAKELSDLYKRKEEIQNQFGEMYKKYYDYLNTISDSPLIADRLTWTPNTGFDANNALRDLFTYRKQLQAIDDKINGTPYTISTNTGFIPFNLSLTVDGLSGMKIYNKFLIDTDALPANYPKTSEFLIKNIIHKIENNKWITTLESLIISKGDNSTFTASTPPPRSAVVVPNIAVNPTLTITTTVTGT